MAAVDVPRYHPEWPQIGKVVDIMDDHFEILWYSRSATHEVWEKYIENDHFIKEKLSKQVVVLAPFDLTPTGRIPKKVKCLLQEYDCY